MPIKHRTCKRRTKLGFYISLAGPITFKNSKNADEIIQMIPLEKCLLKRIAHIWRQNLIEGQEMTQGI